MKKLAQQFISLENLKIEFYCQCDEVVFLFCQYLKNTIDKNDVKIKLELDEQFD